MFNKTKPMKLKGHVHIIPEPDVDTDMIFHNRHLHITDSAEMRRYIFGNLQGHEDFPQEVKPGDILIVGHNFGCGSSRQQAVDGFIALGVSAVIGESFGAIYKRNAINAGWPLIECEGIIQSGLKDGDEIELDLNTGGISRPDGAAVVKGKGLGQVQQDIYFAEGLLSFAKAVSSN